jgi:hypothetical protein
MSQPGGGFLRSGSPPSSFCGRLATTTLSSFGTAHFGLRLTRCGLSSCLPGLGTFSYS